MTNKNKIPLPARETDPEKYESQLRRLRFQDEIEAAYLERNLPSFIMGLRIGIVFAILINIGFYLVDRQIAELAPHLSWINFWRYQAGIPIFIVIGLLTLRLRSDLTLNVLAFLGLAVTSLLVLAIMFPIPANIKDYYWTGLNILILYPFLLMNMRYRFALANGVFIFCLFITAGSTVVEMSHGGYMSALGILATSLGIGAVGGFLLERFKRRDFLQGYLTQIEVNDLQRSNIKLESLSHMDPLADIANRRYFDSNLEKEWARCRRNNLPISLLLVDIDRFKLYNDSYGHPAGDHVLKQVARCLQNAVRRPADFVARYGGEEFAVVLADTRKSGTGKTGERILKDVCGLGIQHEYRPAGEEPIVTVSIGAAVIMPSADNSLDSLLEMADEALYEAKKGGRNRLVARDTLGD